MKKRFVSSFAILALALAGAVTGLQAQTTEEGPGPSEQPSAPMEMGQGESAPAPQLDQPYDNSQPDQPMAEAQPGGPSGEEPAKTNQGVGRISMIHGDVSTQRGDSGDWSAAVLNQPVLGGDKVSTAAGGRAEVQLDFANIVRLGSNAQANIATFTKDRIQIQLSQGVANYSVFNESEAEPELDTPNVAVHPAHKDVVLRIEVRPDGDSIVIVRKGEAQISTPKGIADLKQGDMATVRGSADDAHYKISPAPDRDDWDLWNSDRDRMIHSAKSWHHTNKYYTGTEDLDSNGKWENAPDYGDIWVPNEPEGWAPYRDGNWVWEPYYGWTWVGFEPWGWAPYHYGRWMSYGGSWAWWPGPGWGSPLYRPFWAPAYVSFFGFGGGWGFGFGWGGWGGFGWLPIGPCDRFFPWWGGYRGRFGVVGFNRFGGLNRFGGIAPLHGGTRFSNLSHINDPHIGRALSTVGAARFGAGRINAVAATREQLSSARMMTGNLPVVPTRASLSASGREAAPSTIHNGGSQRFAGTHTIARPESFQQQTAHLQQSMQQNHFSPVNAGGRMAGTVATESRGVAPGGKPSAGTPAAGREVNNSERNAVNRMGSGEQRANGNPRSFAPPNASIRSQAAQPSRAVPERSTGQAAPTNHTEQSSPSRAETSRGEWRSFTPLSRNSEAASRGGNNTSSGRNESGSYWNRTAPSSNYSRGSAPSSSYERGSNNSRPQLSMRQPIVQPRSSGGYGAGGYGGGYGGYRGTPNYGASRPTPGYGGGARSMPSYGGSSRGSYSGGSHSAPSSGGGHSSGGHSSGGSSGHSSSGGGHSSGGHHR